ncbi:3'(2'),5'-bisphosphate nucleotidase CysQ [Salinisphaera sp. Q1T1-3]|uniref:3'(2'),5'-bisphosphate nucleotidase CysQ n=1 Tax=Salinisphaera sp. Q1T1-3 TaxID=2321229 RepID=UPI000E721EA8|nr:3'(2'),5'-bisphosphate nucleotidase CysQ [Salinisphaera sp. Q1T1-3]RJS94308.1 3'(2'),5'-bisphosphate nucleotidase [Salinisphaera sp. Q1T1-3]
MEISHELLDTVCRIAMEAGAQTLPIYHSEFDVETKKDDSPLTQADLAAHRVIAQRLEAAFPDMPQLSEEGAAIDYDTRSEWREYWLVDPLDGTREFVNKNDQFTINIALIRDGRPVLGVVYAPALDTLWAGGNELGAFKQIGDGERTPIQVGAAHHDRPRVLVSRSHRSDSIDQLLSRMPDFEPVSMGSSLKFCIIAEHGADFYPRLGPTSEWDTAAGHAVLKAAGGQVTDTRGRPLRYNETDSLLNDWFIAYGDVEHDWQGYLAK